MTSSNTQTIWQTEPWQLRSSEIADSYARFLGEPLVEATSPGDLSEQLYFAPFVLVSHGCEPDPILNYGNQSALGLWNVDVETLCRMPSRLTAEPIHRDERVAMLDRVTRDGYIDDYSGVRIAANGRRFLIEQATVWNVQSADKRPAGQAAMFTHWTWLDEQDC